MKRILFSLLLLAPFFASAQSGSLSQSVYRSRVNDSTATISANVSPIAQGYAPFYWNNQATVPHWEFWTGSAYEHVFTFSGGSMVYPSAGLAKSTGSAWGTSIIPGTGVETWLTTPSWTNFNSAITGTAPFWGLSGTSTLTSDVAIDGSYTIDIGGTTPLTGIYANASGTSSAIVNSVSYVNLSGGVQSYIISGGNGVNTAMSTAYNSFTSNFNSRSRSDNTGYIQMNLNTGSIDRIFKFDETGTTLNIGSDASQDLYKRDPSGYLVRIPLGSSGDVLTNVSGTVGWAAPSGGGGLTVGTSTITSGTDTYALYNNAGVLGNRAVTGTGNSVLSTSPTLVTPILGTPSSVTLTNATGLPPTTGISGWPANASGVLTNNGSGTLTWGAGGGSSSLSGLTVATATNTINNTNYQQNWQWSTLGSGTGLALSSSSTAAASNTQTLLSASLSGANATSTQTTYAGSFTNTHTGTASTNIAGYFKASGGTTNQGLIVEADNGLAGTPFQQYPIATFRRSTGVGAGIQLGYGTRGFSDPGTEAVGSIQAVGGTKLILGTPSYPKAIYVNDVGGVSLGGAADVNNIDATVNALLPIAFSTPTIAANTSRSSIYGSSSITGGTPGDFVIQSRSVAGKKIGLYTGVTPTGRLLASDGGIEILNGKLTLTDAPTAATSSSDGILMRDVSTGEVKRLGIGQSLSIVSGNLSIRTTATKTVNETRATNYGVVGASASATSAIGVNAYYGNSTTLVVDVTVYGIKSDGSGSVTGKVTGRFRKDSSGTFTVDDAGTSTTSDVLILASIVPEINSTNPQIKINTGASAAGYDFSFTAICSFITY